MNPTRRHLAAAALVLGFWVGASVSGCQDTPQPKSEAVEAETKALAPTSGAGASTRPTPPKTTPARPKVAPEVVAKQDAIRARLTELVDDPKTDAFEDTDTLVKEFPGVEFELLMAIEGERSIKVKIKGGEEFDVLPASRRKSTIKK